MLTCLGLYEEGDVEVISGVMPGFPGALYHATLESSWRETPPYQDGGKPDSAERSGDNTDTWLKS